MPNKKKLLAIGCGPSNLSLMSLMSGIEQHEAMILERSESFNWHSGMQLPGAELQVSFLKDLVTLADPTNPLSFLSFLKENGLLYRTLVSSRVSVSRKMFERYYKWAIQKLGNIRFGAEVQDIALGKDMFQVLTKNERYSAHNVCIGIGKQSYTPAFDDPDRDKNHSSNFASRMKSDFSRQMICVIGGGQSAAEIVEFLLNLTDPPKEIVWVCRRPMLFPLDDSPFVNEIYTPAFAEYFHALPENARLQLNRNLRMTSDGISSSTLDNLYSHFYRNAIERDDGPTLRLKFSTEVKNVKKLPSGSRKVFTRDTLTDYADTIHCDQIVYATGYQNKLPDFLDGIAPHLTFENSGEVRLNADFSAHMKVETNAKLFLQNAGVGQFGLADQNLSLGAWRSSKIVNAIMGKEHYFIPTDSLAGEYPTDHQQENTHQKRIEV
ncbi:MAG: SidA/IucD/PvdA family monooxygenase [Pseudoruegeria sp.]